MPQDVPKRQRPLLKCLVIFLGLTALFVVLGPFAATPEMSYEKFLLFGTIYSGLFSVLAIGLSLTPPKMHRYFWFIFLALFLAFVALFIAICIAGPWLFDHLAWILPSLLIASLVVAAIALLFAIYGWFRFFKK